MSAPRCLQCKAPISKRTEQVDFAHNDPNPPKNKAECQKRTNLEVVAVRYWRHGHVMHFSTWDGVSYSDLHFCKRSCAEAFGRRAANAGVRI